MSLVEKEISFQNQTLILSNMRTIYWAKEQSLLLSDLHLGKSAHFRKNGISIPSQVVEKDLLRLQFLLSHYKPKKIFFIGDLIHAEANTEMDLFIKIRSLFSNTKFILIKGNHDRLSDRFFYELGIDSIHHEYQLNTIKLTHDCMEDEKDMVISGHIHPGVTIKLPTQQRKNLPCFVISEKRIILPAFSIFTGLNTHLKNTEETIFFAITDKNILEIKH